MKLKYKFNLKAQILSGIISFFLVAIITYLSGDVNWPVAIVLGIVQFIMAGFYDYNKCKQTAH
jgi:hypothetical protein